MAAPFTVGPRPDQGTKRALFVAPDFEREHVSRFAVRGSHLAVRVPRVASRLSPPDASRARARARSFELPSHVVAAAGDRIPCRAAPRPLRPGGGAGGSGARRALALPPRSDVRRARESPDDGAHRAAPGRGAGPRAPPPPPPPTGPPSPA